LESGHRNQEKNNKKKHRAKKKTLQAQPSEEKNGDTPLSYSGRTSLRREQCGVRPKGEIMDSVRRSNFLGNGMKQ
jgi:hypothetical protein